jgi:bacterioferritin-associated ferredoxin
LTWTIIILIIDVNDNYSYFIPMYICICNAVTERQVKESASDGVRSLDELTAKLGVGAGCGRCRECATELLREACGALAPRKILDACA